MACCLFDRRSGAAVVTAVFALAVAACSGSGDEPAPATTPPPTQVSAPITALEASRFLNQATFGATTEEIERLRSIGYSAWLVEEFAKPQESLLQSVLLVEASKRVYRPTGNPAGVEARRPATALEGVAAQASELASRGWRLD